MKGILLAGGSGSRLNPVTRGVSKHLLPVGDKPLIYYPLSVLMIAGIREVLLVTTSRDQENFQSLLGDGSAFGISIKYVLQSYPRGIAEAFLLCEEHINEEPVALVLGDNVFYGYGFGGLLRRVASDVGGASIFGYRVNDPERFGVLSFGPNGKINSIDEKPKNPASNIAVTGLYFYDHRVVTFAKELVTSDRGELEITDINRRYLELGELNVEIFGRGFAWLDTGTHGSLMDASNFINAIEARQGLKVACLEEIAFSQGWINFESLEASADMHLGSTYGIYLKKLVDEYAANGR